MRVIRTLQEADDFTALGQVLVESWRHSYRGLLPGLYLERLVPARFSAALRAEPARTIALFEQERPLGLCTTGFAREPDREGWGEIISLYLLPEKTGCGYGRLLLEAAMNMLRQEGCEKVCLWVFANNENAIRFYEHMGFACSGRTQQELFSAQRIHLVEMIRSLHTTGVA